MLRRRRRRSRSMFSSSSGGPGPAMWLQPASRQRHRRRFPVIPVLVLLVLLGAAAAAVAVVHHRNVVEDRRQAAVQRFAAAWAKRDYGAMWDLTTAASKRADSRAQFAASYGDAARQATVTSIRPGRVGKASGGAYPVPVTVATRLFGELRGTVRIPVRDEDGGARVAWTRALRLPGLRGEEVVRRRILARPQRASVLSANGGRLDAEPTAAAIAGTAPSAGSKGSGLEALYDARLSGKPGAQLRFGSPGGRRGAGPPPPRAEGTRRP